MAQRAVDATGDRGSLVDLARSVGYVGMGHVGWNGTSRSHRVPDDFSISRNIAYKLHQRGRAKRPPTAALRLAKGRSLSLIRITVGEDPTALNRWPRDQCMDALLRPGPAALTGGLCEVKVGADQ